MLRFTDEKGLEWIKDASKIAISERLTARNDLKSDDDSGYFYDNINMILQDDLEDVKQKKDFSSKNAINAMHALLWYAEEREQKMIAGGDTDRNDRWIEMRKIADIRHLIYYMAACANYDDTDAILLDDTDRKNLVDAYGKTLEHFWHMPDLWQYNGGKAGLVKWYREHLRSIAAALPMKGKNDTLSEEDGLTLLHLMIEARASYIDGNRYIYTALDRGAGALLSMIRDAMGGF